MIGTVFTENIDVVKAKGYIPYWKIAGVIGVHEQTLRNWMKKKLDPKRKEKILAAIEQINQENEEMFEIN